MKHLKTEENNNSNDIYSYSSSLKHSNSSRSKKYHSAHQSREDDQERKKWAVILTVAAVSCIALGILAVIIYTFFFGSKGNIGEVKNTRVESVTTNSVTLSWDEVDGAKGYHIFQSDKKDGKLVQIAGVSDQLTYTVTDLSQATKYSFCVKAYDDNGDSKKFTSLDSVWTLPEKVEITKLSSEQSGEIYAEWSTNKMADGYLLEFRTAGKDYREENRVWIEGSANHSHTLTELYPNVTIAVRVTPYIETGTKTVGEPSDEKNIEVSSAKKEPATEQPTEYYAYYTDSLYY